ncbi:hypothetical protein HOD29_03475 [archaeon]|jgi:hypothetical protein|nr:hypothetical protein [archaeon]
MNKERIISNCQDLLNAYQTGKLGQTKMPEDAHPKFLDQETRLVYFTLPMSLNYQRDSYKLWQSVLHSFEDSESKIIFDIKNSSNLEEGELRKLLTKHKIALQPNKHINTWQRIAKTINENWGSISKLLEASNYDFLKLREIIQIKFKKGFPYLSGPKIFNYWSFIIQEYGGIKLKNSEFIEIAPDTHITKCSVILGVLDENEIDSLTKEKLSERWREILKDTKINPIDMHPPLWFWSRNNFQYKL